MRAILRSRFLNRAASRRLAFAAACLFCGTVAVAAAQARDRHTSDGEFTPEERRLVAGLVQRGMPELIEELIAGRPAELRIHVAHALVRAGQQESVAAERERFFEKAGAEYAKLLKLEKKSNWKKDVSRRLDLAQWRVEWADLLLRHMCAAELDRYEITSGLDFDRARLKERLARADELYREAGKRLEDLDLERSTDEDEFLLMGIAERISTSLEQQRLNAAWTRCYLGMIENEDDIARQQHLEDAMRQFWSISEMASDADQKENARLGLGIARRELGRYDEAARDLERVENSTQPLAITARAAYERARALMSAGWHDEARTVLDRLANLPTRSLRESDAGALFYIRLAPLVRAYSYMHASRRDGLSAEAREKLRKQAEDEFANLAKQGGAWPRMTQVYLDALAGRHRELEQLTPVELALVAGQCMNEGDYAKAARAWGLILARKDAEPMHAEAGFNLGVCHFQMRDVRSAAAVFLEGARGSPGPKIAEKVYEYAYRCWRQIAAQSKQKEDFLSLAEAAELLATKLPEHRDATEAAWIAALALDEAGAYQRAIGLYGRVPPDAANYWTARRNLARCRQRLYETIPPTSSLTSRHNSARDCVDTWLKLADDLEAAGNGKNDASTSGPASARARAKSADGASLDADMRAAWIEEARLLAASILAGDDLRDFARCIRVLEGVPRSGRALGLHIRSLQGQGDIRGATRVLEEYLKQGEGGEAGGVLVSLAAEMELEVHRLQSLDRDIEARRMAAETIPTMRHLLGWMKSQNRPVEDQRVVKFSLAKLLAQAEMPDEAAKLLDELMAEAPSNGAYVRTAALLQESLAESPRRVDRTGALNKAEALWARLLEDAMLRESSPDEYWEARYRWLRHQLRHGRAREVVEAIHAEEAWFPELGGVEWRAKFRALADEAGRQME